MMNLVVTHPTYARTLKLLDSTVGREKVMRTLQYWSRFLAYYLYRKGYSSNIYTFWKTLQQQLAFCRKLFRVGKPLTHFKLGVSALTNQTADPILRFSTVGRQIGYFGYMSLDTVLWIHAAKLASLKNMPKIQKIAQRFWLFGLVCGLINSLRKFQQAKVKEAALNSESEKDVEYAKRVQTDKSAAQRQFVWDLLDTTIPLSGLKIVEFDDGFVGLCGFITSLLGLRSVW